MCQNCNVRVAAEIDRGERTPIEIGPDGVETLVRGSFEYGKAVGLSKVGDARTEAYSEGFTKGRDSEIQNNQDKIILAQWEYELLKPAELPEINLRDVKYIVQEVLAPRIRMGQDVTAIAAFRQVIRYAQAKPGPPNSTPIFNPEDLPTAARARKREAIAKAAQTLRDAGIDPEGFNFIGGE